MKRAFTLILLAFATAACIMAAPDNAPVKKSKKASSPSTKVHQSPSQATRNRTVARKPAAAATPSKVKYVRGRNGKLVRVKTRAAPAPSYQLHPDPERYQQIQQALADKGYFNGQVNGQWGDDSVDALKRFQADQKLDADGHLNSLSLIGLGLGPKHDGVLSVAPAPTSPSVPNNSAPKTGPSTTNVPLATPPPPPPGANPDR
jgi:hypothetical protein